MIFLIGWLEDLLKRYMSWNINCKIASEAGENQESMSELEVKLKKKRKRSSLGWALTGWLLLEVGIDL